MELYKKKEGSKKLHQRYLTHKDSTIKCTTLLAEEREYRCGSLIAAANGSPPLSYNLKI